MTLLNFFKYFLFYTFLILISSNEIVAQNLPKNISIENVGELSDDELFQYYEQITAQGYSMQQIKTLAKARGVSSAKIADFERRIEEIKNTVVQDNVPVENVLEIVNSSSVTTKNNSSSVKSEIFGYDFFNNENISFTPNLNLSTPVNYVLGPGDEIVVNVWGAAERTYNLSVDREGAVRLTNIGPVFVNGLTIADATNRLKTSLKKIYNGITAPDTSPYKVFLSVSLANVRSVQVNVIGQVKTPGTYSVSSLATVLNVLYAAGGPSQKGTLRDVKLVRNGAVIATFDMYDYLLNGSQKGNTTVRDQDVILVSPYISRVAISGAVKRPGIFEMKPAETFDDLLKYVSGFTSTAHKELMVLERIEDDKRKVKEIKYSEISSAQLKDGDNIFVRSIIDKYVNKIEIEGAVNRPGVYELSEGLTLYDLIEKAAGLLDKAFLERATITRSIDEVSYKVIPFSVADIISKKKIIKLNNQDVVKIYNKYSLKEDKFVSISGAVNDPKRVTFLENMTIEDLILMANGFKKGADVTKIDIYRKIKDDDFETLTETFRVEVASDLSNNGTSVFKLEPDDQVSVRYIKGFSNQINVKVEGEVNYPGQYTLQNKSERISDIIEKAGGLTEYSYPAGASLVRKNPFYKPDIQSNTASNVVENLSKEDEDINLNNPPKLSVGIDLVEILNNPNNRKNLILKEGDVLIIPNVKQTVKVEGEVLVPSLVRYDKNLVLKDYINMSGGFADRARKGKTYVVYLNGQIKATKQFLFFKSYPRLEPGALVIVPERPIRTDRASTQEVLGIASGVVTIAFLIDNIFGR